MPAPWQLPPGVTPGLWDYLHDPGIARAYDDQLAASPLLQADLDFVLAHCPVPGRFIDLGCGTGRLAIALAQRGHQVTAVDLSEEMLRVARAKATAAGVRIDLLKANLVELGCLAGASFDAAACLFSTLGMIAGDDARRRFLTHVRRILRPGGTFIVHVHNRWFHLGTAAGRRLLIRHYWDAASGRTSLGDFAMPPHQGIGSFPMHLFTRRAITRLLRDVGFAVETIRPVGLRPDGTLRAPWWFGRLRAYGYLLAGRAVTESETLL